MKSKTLSFSLCIYSLIVMVSCEKDVNDGLTSLINIKQELAGVNCNSGGYKIESGIDINRNNLLDSTEIQNSEFICNVVGTLALGEAQSDFIAGEIYQASTDGFLSVQYSSSTNYGTIQGYIYSDSTSNPSTIVGMVNFVPGSTVIPINRNNYWKVTSISYCDELISWIPILE
ncbi:MAG: hypothetical protein JXB49_37355 [Bacteroidales bacterium]|nr:hypothetical protein [Bacteroidales bacterium]